MSYLNIDKTSLSDGELYTRETNKKVRVKKSNECALADFFMPKLKHLDFN